MGSIACGAEIVSLRVEVVTLDHCVEVFQLPSRHLQRLGEIYGHLSHKLRNQAFIMEVVHGH